VSITVREREAPHTLRMVRGEDERNTPAAVVANEVDLLNVESVEKLLKHSCLRIRGDILSRLDLTCAVSQEVERDTSAHVCEPRHLVTPQIAVEQDAVNKEGHRALTLFDVADTS
jgi:hypothetical protein